MIWSKGSGPRARERRASASLHGDGVLAQIEHKDLVAEAVHLHKGAVFERAHGGPYMAKGRGFASRSAFTQAALASDSERPARQVNNRRAGHSP
jgi:hypothetical protein